MGCRELLKLTVLTAWTRGVLGVLQSKLLHAWCLRRRPGVLSWGGVGLELISSTSDLRCMPHGMSCQGAHSLNSAWWLTLCLRRRPGARDPGGGAGPERERAGRRAGRAHRRLRRRCRAARWCAPVSLIEWAAGTCCHVDRGGGAHCEPLDLVTLASGAGPPSAYVLDHVAL